MQRDESDDGRWRVTHAPADPRAPYEATRRSLLHQSRAGAREPQSGFPDGAGDGAPAGGVVQFLDKAADVPVVVPQLLFLVVNDPVAQVVAWVRPVLGQGC